MGVCAVALCNNSHRTQVDNKNLVFHVFPKGKYRNEWIAKCKRDDPINADVARICSEHFLESDYERDLEHELLNLPARKKKKLKPDSVPSINMPLQNSDAVKITTRAKRMEKRENKRLVLKITSTAESHEGETPMEVNEGTESELPQGSENCGNIMGNQFNSTYIQDRAIENLQNKCKELTNLLRKEKLLTKCLLKRLEASSKRISKANQKNRKYVKAVNKLFSKAQLQRLYNNKNTNWSVHDIVKSLSLMSVSKKAYETLREVWKIPLPGPRTIRRWAACFTCEPGIIEDVLLIMEQQSKTMDMFSRKCVISFDEMSLCAKMEWDKSRDLLIGPHSKAQVLLASGLHKKWRQPVFYDYDTKMTVSLLKENISKLESIGFPVAAMVSDLGGTNQELWKDLNITPSNSSFQNPTDKTRNIWVFPDGPHMIKLMRNHVVDGGFVLESGVVVNKRTLEVMIEHNCGELKVHKLTYDIINVKGAERMKVSHAAKVFSHHTATLASVCFPTQPEISEFFQLMDDYFDIFNSKVPVDEDKPIRSGFGMRLDAQIKRLTEIQKMVSSIRALFFSKKKQKLVPRKGLLPCQKGILVSINSLLGLYKETNVTYIITRRLNQDPLESLFSVIRSLGRTYDNPLPSAFRSRIKMILLGGKVRAPVSGNVEFDEDHIYYVSVQLMNLVKLTKKEISSEEILPTYEETNAIMEGPSLDEECLDEKGKQFSEAALYYLAGYIAFVCKKKYGKSFGDISRKCHLSTNIFAEEWIRKLSRGGLMVPNNEILDVVSKCETFFCKHFEVVKRLKHITQELETRMLSFYPGVDSDIIKEFVKVRIKIRVKHINTVSCRQEKTSKHAKKCKQFVKSACKNK